MAVRMTRGRFADLAHRPLNLGGGYEGCWLDYTLGVNITLLGFSVMSLAISSTVPYSMMPAWQ